MSIETLSQGAPKRHGFNFARRGTAPRCYVTQGSHRLMKESRSEDHEYSRLAIVQEPHYDVVRSVRP